ncbi:MAG: prepilin-type N-terminal cleavage/methylation domain-containing protein [Sedimentisphaerales bacterium]|nr:prepilin-type N-terminal cleavage/methylation domain-containing protein [Sedimentisphaerales bacterium]
MRQKRVKKTANLQHRLRRNYYCRNSKISSGLRGGSSGFTLAEILLVVVIIAIAAMIAVPMISSADSIQIRSAANMIAADLEYAKSMAISRQKNYSLVFNPAGDYYEVHDPNGIIKHPVNKRFDYRVDFSSDSRLAEVIIEKADFDPGSSSTITFDYLGSPYSGIGTSAPLNSGEIIIRAGGFSMTISVEPGTGFISIAD